MRETEIAQQLNVDQSTISRDVKSSFLQLEGWFWQIAQIHVAIGLSSLENEATLFHTDPVLLDSIAAENNSKLSR
jgi:IS30 family transposase